MVPANENNMAGAVGKMRKLGKAGEQLRRTTLAEIAAEDEGVVGGNGAEGKTVEVTEEDGSYSGGRAAALEDRQPAEL
jgi:hypothetical protein